MKRQFNTDCEGPISKNDNAFELSQEFIPQGGELFAKLSKYDDFLADISKKPGYKAGNTLKLILPFLKAYGVTDAVIGDFSAKNILLVPDADVALTYVSLIMPTFIISTSYRPYINALCEIIKFPIENTYCTELAINKYKIPEVEINYLKKLHDEILELPTIDIPASAKIREDLDYETLKSIDRLDAIFWYEIINMASGKMLEEVNPVGGIEKAEAIKRSCEKTGCKLSDVMYIGDSITDTEAMRLVKESGGLAVSFNGNRYAIKASEIACISPRAMILAALATVFLNDGFEKVRDIASVWEYRKRSKLPEKELFESMLENTTLKIIDDSNMEELIAQSEKFRKQVRGEKIGKLG